MLDGQPLGEYPELGPTHSTEYFELLTLAYFARLMATASSAMRTLTQNQRDIEDALIRLRCARRVGDEKETLALSKRVDDLLNRESRGRGCA